MKNILSMFKRVLINIGTLCALLVFVPKLSLAQSLSNEFKVGEEGYFILNGEPFIVKAAELHYPRIPRQYWDQRIKMCKALGMNTVCLYTFWNVHETKEGVFNFSEENDIRHFIKLCQENDLYVILRPGPYVCAEWEMGGLPWWLLKKTDIRLRDNDPYFLERVSIFETELAEQVRDLTIEQGGPIIMIQVENEYGAFGENKPYVSNIRNMLKHLYGDKVVMFQCDWASNFTLNGLDDLVWTMNFGTGADIESQFTKLKELRPKAPLMCSEFWSGWFDKWGAPHETRPADEMIKGIDEMLSKNISFSLYMTHGGTNWGHWAGANSPGYAPDVTSYDYDAPIDESGNPTPKYHLLRETLQKFSGLDSLPAIPSSIIPIKVDTFYFSEVAPLKANMPEPVGSQFINPMEFYDQGYGSIMYSTTTPEINSGAVLNVVEPHDYARIFVNGKFIGKLDRRLGETTLVLPECHKGDRLDIFVEAMGRINFGIAIKDYKGITENVYFTETIDGVNLTITFDYWDVYLFPDELDFYSNQTFIPIKQLEKEEGDRYTPGIYRGIFNIEKPSDTFLNFSSWGKGLVYVNGHALGRIWNIGPQQTLYTPGPWLKEGENEILVFDIIGPTEYISYGENKPVLDQLQYEVKETNLGISSYDVGSLTPVYGGAFPQGNGWKSQIFKNSETGRYLVIEIMSSFNDNNYIAISELYALNAQGKRINRESWKIAYVSSQDTDSGNNTAEKIFDLQESTFWKSQEGITWPQVIVVDMGKEETVEGLEYLPRMESGAPGAVNEFRIYVTNNLSLKKL